VYTAAFLGKHCRARLGSRRLTKYLIDSAVTTPAEQMPCKGQEV